MLGSHIISKRPLGNGLQLVKVRLPNPQWSPMETLREAAGAKRFQVRLFRAMAPGAPWRQLLDRAYDPVLPRRTYELWETEGLNSEAADLYLSLMVESFSLHSPAQMFFFYAHADPRLLDQAISCFGFWPMQVRFLDLVDRTNFQLLHCRCPGAVEEFQMLCEELGLIYCISQRQGEEHKHGDPLELPERLLEATRVMLAQIGRRTAFLGRERQFAEMKEREWQRLYDQGKVAEPFLYWYEKQLQGTEFEIRKHNDGHHDHPGKS